MGKLGDELTRVNSASTPQEGQPTSSPEQKEKEVAKFRKAIQLAEQVDRELRTTIEAIKSAEPANVPEDDPPSAESIESDDPPPAIPSPFKDATAPSQIAIDKLHELRRLFFTIVQRLQEAAQHQSSINDETHALAVKEEFPLADRGPIGQRQKELQSSADQIADELKEQSAAAANSGNGPASADQQAANDQTAQNFEKAAELVIGSSLDMASSATNLQAETDFDLSGTRTTQQSALEKLLAAIELLQPPSDSDDNQDQPQDEQENQEQQPSEDDQQEQPQDNQSNSLLQMVRDKEAQRRDEKAERAKRLVPANGPDW